MDTLFTFLYALILFIFCVSALFVAYHLLRYSLNKAFGLVGVVVFSVLFCVLLIMNIVSFKALNLQKIFGLTSQSNFLPSTPLAPQPSFKSQKTPW